MQIRPKYLLPSLSRDKDQDAIIQHKCSAKNLTNKAAMAVALFNFQFFSFSV